MSAVGSVLIPGMTPALWALLYLGCGLTYVAVMWHKGQAEVEELHREFAETSPPGGVLVLAVLLVAALGAVVLLWPVVMVRDRPRR